MSAEDIGLMMAGVAIAQIIILLGWRLLMAALPKQSQLAVDEHEALMELHTWHDAKDPDGRPLWYTPIALSESQNRLTEALLAISATMTEMQKAMERSEVRSEKQEARADEQFKEVMKELRRYSSA